MNVVGNVLYPYLGSIMFRMTPMAYEIQPTLMVLYLSAEINWQMITCYLGTLWPFAIGPSLKLHSLSVERNPQMMTCAILARCGPSRL